MMIIQSKGVGILAMPILIAILLLVYHIAKWFLGAKNLDMWCILCVSLVLNMGVAFVLQKLICKYSQPQKHTFYELSILQWAVGSFVVFIILSVLMFAINYWQQLSIAKILKIDYIVGCTLPCYSTVYGLPSRTQA